MKKLLPIIILAVVGFGIYGWVKGFYNTTIKLEENINEKWSKVESAYQRRADLIPNLMKVAERYAEHEQETFVKVIEARSKATSIQIDPSNITPQQLQQFQQAQSGLTSALSRLLAVFERYPELKANENYKEMMNELERTENRIKVERDRYNEEITPYNNHIRQFPGNVLAGMFGFEKKDRFNADEGAEKAPDVNDFIKK
ncbi:LemA family protein [Tenacibaculum sp. S7007]|uniref:LemA family protein n=1 Tax=Tenacibaculum pelagium TaxID=2759527 RepID=A0A839AQ82_9FLAO|nr:LemA family protein [Tenacibaculum pelagium]MBA6157235.1 LemA family protein [Tenacibaculum pelagium]